MRHIVTISGCKKCTCCGEEKAATIEFFPSKKSNKSGLAADCKTCRNKKIKDYVKRRPDIFKKAQDKYKTEKREAYLSAQRRCYIKNKSKIRQYQIDNKEAFLAATAMWRKKNGRTERDRVSERERYRKNPDSKKKSSTKWQKKYPEKKSAINHKRRSLIRGVLVHHTDEEWFSLKAKYKNTCLRCGKYEPDIVLTKDRVVPISKGGGNGIDNIQPLCFSCNSSKGNRYIKDYRT